MRGVNFAEIEKLFVQDRITPDFDWVPFDHYSRVNPLSRPLSYARVAFVSTSGAHLADQEPFDIKGPAGDPSFRSIPSNTSLEDIVLTHRGYNIELASQDKNVVFPLEHLRTAEDCGRIGSLGQTVYSFMGFISDTRPLIEETAPQVARELLDAGTDLVLLAPT